MHAFDDNSLAHCALDRISLQPRKKAHLGAYSHPIRYANSDLKLKLTATDLRIVCRGGLALLTFTVSERVERFFDHLDLQLSATTATITAGRICVSTTDLSKIPLNMHENIWYLEVQVHSLYESEVGNVIINTLQLLR